MLNQNIILFDGSNRDDLLPLTFTRPIAELRVGITSIREKWQRFSDDVSWLTKEYLSGKFPARIGNYNLFVDSSLIPTKNLIDALDKLESDQVLVSEGEPLAFKSDTFLSPEKILSDREHIVFEHKIISINNLWDIFEKNDEVLRLDYNYIINNRKSAQLSKTNNIINPENIFIEEGAIVEFATINAKDGPVYIGKDSEIMEGALIRGPLALCEHSVIKMGAKIYGATTIGPWCKVAGEVQNSVITGFSNKGHEGYLGNSILGEWCNIGADSNNSNLKNNYDKVKLWNYKRERFVNTNLQFCGLIMGDHSKCGINTMFNTGTVVGVSANIFGSGFPRNFIPSFSWGGAAGFSNYTLKKAIDTAKIVMARRNIELSEEDIKIFEYTNGYSEKYRK